jgi:hypothetical protein
MKTGIRMKPDYRFMKPASGPEVCLPEYRAVFRLNGDEDMIIGLVNSNNQNPLQEIPE